MSRTTQLPVVVGQPYTPKRNPKTGIPEEKPCESEWCKTNRPELGEHTHEVSTEAPRNGSGWLERKASGEILYHAPWLEVGKSTMPKEWAPRVEKVEKFVARLKKDIEQSLEKMESKSSAAPQVIGKVHGGKWKLIATDGHRALFVQAHEQSGEIAADNDFTECAWKEVAGFVVGSELHLAVRRALIVAPENGHKVKLTKAEGQALVVVSSSDESAAFGEGVELELHGREFWEAALNGKYLEAVCGVWPMRVMWDAKWKDEYERPVVFGDVEDRFRVVIMPMRG